jgi:soluble lytic murein transglycosylase-like protein
LDWVEVGDPLRDSALGARSMTDTPGARPEVRHLLLGLAVLLAAVVPAYLVARGSGPVGPGNLAGAEAGVTVEIVTPEIDRLEIDAHIHHVAARYQVSPRLVAAIIEAESEFNPRAVSRRGARGLMQLMPTTAASLQIGDSFDPFANVEGGVRHLRRLMNRYRGQLPLVLAAYNAGEQ